MYSVKIALDKVLHDRYGSDIYMAIMKICSLHNAACTVITDRLDGAVPNTDIVLIDGGSRATPHLMRGIDFQLNRYPELIKISADPPMKLPLGITVDHSYAGLLHRNMAHIIAACKMNETVPDNVLSDCVKAVVQLKKSKNYNTILSGAFCIVGGMLLCTLAGIMIGAGTDKH